MGSLIVALPNDPVLAGEIGKKGSENGITFYNRKTDNGVIVVMAPTDVSSKFYAIGEIMSIADVVVISTSKVDALLGESIIAASMLGKKTIFTKDSDISSILKSVSPPRHEFVERKELLGRLTAFDNGPSKEPGELRIDIDKSFPVKGVGTVLLGIVRSGKVRVHDSLKSSNKKDISVRSIQVHDDDCQEANVGDRVGLAIKGAEYTDVEKGDILSKEIKPYISSFSAEIKKSPLSEELDIDNINCTLITGFSAVNCKMTKNEKGFAIKLEKPTALCKDDGFILIREKAPRVFAAGKITEVG